MAIKTWLLALSWMGLVGVGCQATPVEGSGLGSAGESESESESESETRTTDEPTTMSTGGTEGPTGTLTGGSTEEPTTEDSTTEDSTTDDSTTDDSTTEDSTTEDSTTEDLTTENSATDDPTSDDGDCQEFFVDELGAEEAKITGDWQLIMSQQGEGMIAFWGQGAQSGTVTWTYNVPCADSWHVWVRMYDEGPYDSIFVQVDDGPQTVTDVHCGPQGNKYRWDELKRVDEDGGPCDYLEDPWVQEWEGGPHELGFSFRESDTISRLIFTNNPDFTP